MSNKKVDIQNRAILTCLLANTVGTYKAFHYDFVQEQKVLQKRLSYQLLRQTVRRCRCFYRIDVKIPTGLDPSSW